MKKILVPTDFSSNSRAGIRFAIHWATLQDLELIFLHVLYILRPTTWSDAYFEKYAAKEKKGCRIKFEKIISTIYRQMNVKPGKHSFLIKEDISADITILDHCRQKKDIDYICISTRGAGKFKKIFGTNTGNLITKSHVPVLAIPQNYKVNKLRKLLYATDLNDFSGEMQQVLDFAEPLKTSVEVIHFSWPDSIYFDEETVKTFIKRKFSYGIKLHFQKKNAVHSFIENLQEQVKKIKPSVVVMFTNQNRTFFQKLFKSSKAETLSFETKVPLLVFNKSLADKTHQSNLMHKNRISSSTKKKIK